MKSGFNYKSARIKGISHHSNAKLTCVIGPGPILRLTDDSVSAQSTLAKVFHLEVTARLVKSETVQQVVVHVARVEQLSYREIATRINTSTDQLFGLRRFDSTGLSSHVFLRSETVRLAILVIEDVGRIDRSAVVQPRVLTFPIPVT